MLKLEGGRYGNSDNRINDWYDSLMVVMGDNKVGRTCVDLSYVWLQKFQFMDNEEML